MAIKLHVGNLSSATKDSDLFNLFNSVGLVMSASFMGGKNVGFVNMSSEDAAQNAIKVLNGSTLRERQITVRLAAPNESE